VGVGQADRELSALVHAHQEGSESLKRVLDAVKDFRVNSDEGATKISHPLALVARARWLRSEVMKSPSLLGFESLRPLAPLASGSSFSDLPCAGLGIDENKNQVIVVFSVGANLEFIFQANDYRNRENRSASLLLVAPVRDLRFVSDNLVNAVGDCRKQSIPTPW